MVDVIMDTSSVNMSVAERAASQVTATPLDLDDMRRGLTLYSPAAGWETTRRTITTTVEATPGYELTRKRAPFVEDPVVWRRMPTITNGLYFGLGDLLRTLARRAGCVMVNFPPGRATWRSPAGLCPVPALGKRRAPEADGLFTYAFRPELLGKRFLDVSVVVSVNSIRQPKNEANRLRLPGYEGVYAGVGYKNDRETTQVPIGDSMVFAGGGELFPFLGNTGPTLSRGGGFTTIGKAVEFRGVQSDGGISPIRDLRGGESWGTLVYRPADRDRAVPIEESRFFLIPAGSPSPVSNPADDSPVAYPREVAFSSALGRAQCTKVRFDLRLFRRPQLGRPGTARWVGQSSCPPDEINTGTAVGLVKADLWAIQWSVSMFDGAGMRRVHQFSGQPDALADYGRPPTDREDLSCMLPSYGVILGSFSTMQTAGTGFSVTIESIGARLT